MLGRMVGTAVTASLLRGVTSRFGGVAGAVAGAALASKKTRGAALAGLVALTAYDLWKRSQEGRNALPTPQVGDGAAGLAGGVSNPFAKPGPQA
ncbi:MAG: hypothetical protein ACK40H_04030 [Sphingomonadaceae bacterium]